MNKDAIKEELKNLINFRNNLWTAFLVVSGATIAFILKFSNLNLIEIFFMLAGVVFGFILFGLYKDTNQKITQYIKKISTGENK